MSPNNHRMDDVTAEYTDLQHLILMVLEIQNGAYREWIPRWADGLYGERARVIAGQLENKFSVVERRKVIHAAD